MKVQTEENTTFVKAICTIKNSKQNKSKRLFFNGMKLTILLHEEFKIETFAQLYNSR